MAQDQESFRGASNSRPLHPSNQLSNQTITFSIATPVVTTILPTNESISDTSFMLQATSYQQDAIIEKSFCPDNDAAKSDRDQDVFIKTYDNGPAPPNDVEIEDNVTGQTKEQGATLSQPVSSNHSTYSQDDESKPCKKRNKVNKKSTKLDAKSKLEKSRQSARECRARKKLRYQYLEDLVSNREKAVVKLREELSMFCELSKRINVGTISDEDRRLLIDQTKENNRSESTSLL